MRKSHIRDYATAAFQFYALQGSAEKYKKSIWDEAVQKQNKLDGSRDDVSMPTEAAIIRAEAAVRGKKEAIADLEAVEFTLHVFENRINGRHMIKALREVYMTEPHRDPERGEISERVRKVSLEIPIGEDAIYRWLRDARRIFAEERGLRI